MAKTPNDRPEADTDSTPVRGVALGLGIPLGVFGAHRFYVGKYGTGILQLCTMGGFGLWWLYDMILIATGEFRDVEGRRMSAWSREEAATRARQGGVTPEEIDGVHAEMRELAERVDFLERMLAQARDKGQVGPGR